MTSGFAQLSNILYLQTMPGIQLSKKDNCVLQSPAANRRILKAAVHDTNNPWRWPKDLTRVHFKIALDMPLSFVMSR
jgi:hypothetical protein